MASITEILKQILSARYGRDVRQAIHDGIQQCYYDGKAGTIDLEARQDIQAIGEDVEALKENTTSINKAVADLQAIKDITETTETTLPNSHAGRFKFDEIGGVMEQDSTAGNQLWSYGDISSGSISNIPWSISAGEYTFSTASTSFELTIRVYYEDNSEEVFVFTQSPTTFTLKKNVVKCNYNSNIAIADVMVNAGTTALPHEKFSGGQPAPNPSYPQEIKKTIVSGVKTHGKNYANVSDKTFTSAAYFTLDAPIFLPKGTYTVHTKCDTVFDIATDFYLTNAEKQNVFRKADKLNKFVNDNYVTFTIDEDCHYITWYFNNTAGNTFTISDFSIMEGSTGTEYEPYTSSEITFSQPIDLYGKNGVQDVITSQNVGRKFGVAVFDGSDDEGWVYEAETNRIYSSIIQNKVKRPISNDKAINMLCSHLVVDSFALVYVGTVGICVSTSGAITAKHPDLTSLEEWIAYLQANPMTVVYELAEETTEALPIADQIALNSLATYDGITYVEFIYEGLEPTFKGEYGTSKVGGYTLEGLLAGRNGELKA